MASRRCQNTRFWRPGWLTAHATMPTPSPLSSRNCCTDLDTHECIVLGAMSDEWWVTSLTSRRRIVIGQRSRRRKPLDLRGKRWLGYSAGKPGILGLDHDAKDMPLDLRERMEARGGAMSVLHSICPALADARRCVSTKQFVGHRRNGNRRNFDRWRMALLCADPRWR